MSEKDFQILVIEKLNKLEKGFESLFGNDDTKDKGQMHWVKAKLEDHNERINSIEKIKQFSSGAFWAFGLMLSTIVVAIWEGGKHLLTYLLHL